MALNANRLGDAMKTAIDGVGDKTDRTALFRAMAAAIIAEFTANGVINIPTLVVSNVSGVTPGGGVSGPGATVANVGTIA